MKYNLIGEQLLFYTRIRAMPNTRKVSIIDWMVPYLSQGTSRRTVITDGELVSERAV
jgi:hypothetical protein